jgi:sec-independent protein translocase protein TatB
MFDVGFSELMVIAVVALIVIGPERLPKVARTLGHLFGRMQRYVNDVKADISREMELEELRKLQNSMQDAARSLEQSVTREISATESEFQKLTDAADPAAEATAAEIQRNSQFDDLDASVTPAGEVPAAEPSVRAHPANASPQLELALDSAPQTPAQKHPG